MVLVVVAYAINILVADNFGPRILFRKDDSIKSVCGEERTARQTLGCVYLAIAVVSIWALIDTNLTIEIAK